MSKTPHFATNKKLLLAKSMQIYIHFATNSNLLPAKCSVQTTSAVSRHLTAKVVSTNRMAYTMFFLPLSSNKKNPPKSV